MRQDNSQEITKIILKPKATCYCPLGDDWYTNEFEITMYPVDYYPDYCDVEKWLNENVRDKSLIIEDAVKLVYDYINETYEPCSLRVISYVNNVESHSPVIVTKE